MQLYDLNDKPEESESVSIKSAISVENSIEMNKSFASESGESELS